MSLSNFGARCLCGFLRNSVSFLGTRTLYSASALGLDAYASARNKVIMQFEDNADKFRSKMSDYVASEPNALIFTEDLKHMLHLVDGTDGDIALLGGMIHKFFKQNKDVRFGSFIFGPVVMRMYYHFNKPIEALEMFMHEDAEGFFDQLISYQLLMDLLYNNEMYDEVIKVFEKVSSKQLLGSKYPKNCIVLVLAACYKMNTKSSYEYTKKLWNDLMVVGHIPMRRAATFAAGLALKQNEPAVCLEILGSLKHPNYVSTRNLKVLALANLGRPDDCFPILRSVLEVDVNREKRNTFCEEVIAAINEAVKITGNADIVNEFERIEKQLRANSHIMSTSLDEMLCQEIVPQPRYDATQPMGGRRTGQPFQNRDQPRKFERPGLRDLL